MAEKAFDFKPPKVSRDLANAVEDDWKRSVQDAAKHRAVKQLEGYDGFKNMVSVAHLRPYHAPNMKDHSGPAPPAFAFTAEGIHGGPEATVGATGRLQGDLVPPDNAMAFDKTWRRTCKTPAERWRYLGLISPDKASSIFKVEITGTALGEILVALAEGYGGKTETTGGEAGEGAGGSDEAGGSAAASFMAWGDESATHSSKAAVGAAVVALMRALASAGRFGLASKLLPGKVKKSLEGLIAALVEGGGCGTEDEAELKALYGVK